MSQIVETAVVAPVTLKEQREFVEDPNIRKILESGYAEIHLSEQTNWLHGYVENPSRHQTELAICALIMFGSMLSAGITWLADFIIQSDSLERLFWGSVSALLLSVTLSCIFVTLNNKAIRKAGFDPNGTYFFLKIKPPSKAFEQYRAAKQSTLFDEICVYGPSEVFKTVTLKDPIIYGVKNRRKFLIAQYDLAKDFER